MPAGSRHSMLKSRILVCNYLVVLFLYLYRLTILKLFWVNIYQLYQLAVTVTNYIFLIQWMSVPVWYHPLILQLLWLSGRILWGFLRLLRYLPRHFLLPHRHPLLPCHEGASLCQLWIWWLISINILVILPNINQIDYIFCLFCLHRFLCVHIPCTLLALYSAIKLSYHCGTCLYFLVNFLVLVIVC